MLRSDSHVKNKENKKTPKEPRSAKKRREARKRIGHKGLFHPDVRGGKHGRQVEVAPGAQPCSRCVAPVPFVITARRRSEAESSCSAASFRYTATVS